MTDEIECKIGSIDKSPFLPVIADFQNGQLHPTTKSKLQCDTFINPKNDKNVVVVSSKKFAYTGEIDDNDLYYTMLAIRNKKTNKIRLVPVNKVSLNVHIPKANTLLDTTLAEAKLTVRDLNLQFGSKKIKRRTEQLERMRLNVSNVEEELKNTIAVIFRLYKHGPNSAKLKMIEKSKRLIAKNKNKPDKEFNNIRINHNAGSGPKNKNIDLKPAKLVAPKVDDKDRSYRPPINRDAQTVEEVYDLKNIIDIELDSLDNMVDELLDNNLDEEEFSPFVKECIFKLTSSKSKNKLKYKILFYIDIIMKFFSKPFQNQSRKFIVKPYPPEICQHVLNEYTLFANGRRSRPVSLRDKALCYIIVLALIALDYKLDLSSLSIAMNAGLKKLTDIARVLGCHMSKETGKIVLKLPLAQPPVAYGKRKRKN